jgi:diguanylate cyclase (GGDEF)-like protein
MKSVDIAVLASLVLGCNCFAQTPPGWSFWGTADGMKESYTSSIALHAGGILTKHGSVSRINLLDGYAIGELPDPGYIGKIHSAPDGTLWIWTAQRLSRYHNSRWESFKVESVTNAGVLRSDTEQRWIFTSNRPPYLQGVVWVAGLDDRHALIMLPDQILEFEAGANTTRVVLESRATGLGSFHSMRPESNGNIWITGKRGLGTLSTPDLKWRESLTPPVGYADLEEPYEGENGELFLTAIDQTTKPVVLRTNGSRWELVYRGDSHNLRGWRGEEKTVWIQDGNRLFHVTATGKPIPVDRIGPLSGVILSVKPDHGDRFWVGTTQGLAMYAPPLWRTPPEIAQIDDVVNAIMEDKRGRVWFSSPHSLICLDGERWQFFPLPKHETPWALHAEGLASLPDETIAIRTTSPDLLLFNPNTRRFRSVRHPAGRDTRLFVQQADGSLLVETAVPKLPGSFALETFDGHEFRPFLNPGASWGIWDLRSVVVGNNGRVWAGGADGFGVLKNGFFTRIGAAEGFADSAAFCLKAVAGGKLLAGGRVGLFEYDGKAWHQILSDLDRVRNITAGRDGSVWVASGTGVHHLQNGKQISYGITEGLPSSVAYRVFEDSRGRVWAGTTRGLSLLHLDADLDPPISRISPDQNPREAPPGGRVRLVFSGTDKWKMTPSDRLLFSWRVDNEPWSAFSSATGASFDKLHPGEHTFQVRAMDRNGNIDPHPPSYHFSVLSAWYETAAFRWLAGVSALTIAILLAIALSYYRLLARKKKFEHDRQEILEMVALRDPLEDILRRVVLAIAENQRGAIGAALHYNGGTLQFLAFAEPQIRLTCASGRWTVGSEGMRASPTIIGLELGAAISIRSANKEVLGEMVALFPRRARQTNEDIALLKGLGRIASVAIEGANLYNQLAHRAHHDVLTGLPNRSLIESELKSALQESDKRGHCVAVLFLDLDRFKQMNDSLGHLFGDFVLSQVAERLIRSIPEGAMAARIGGDEFIVILKQQSGKAEVKATALRILDTVGAPLNLDGTEVYPRASLGISMFPEDGEDAVTLQRRADLALYRAKSRGKNRYEFFSREIGDSVADAFAMEQVLRKALEGDWLELHYQGQFTRFGELAGLEALVRLNHPIFGMVGPSIFIALAEETGLIHRLGEWVLRECCRQIRCWRDAGFAPVKVAVNVSALQFRQLDFAESVGDILDEMQIDPRLIELELTESMIMGEYEESAKQMQKLRDLGVSIAVDDFGTGHCSLAHLHRLPIDVLKIDQSFVREIDARSCTWPLVQAIVGLAHNLKLAVVAEGVETEYQRSALHELDCDCLQGYGLHRPQPAAEIEHCLLTKTTLSIAVPVPVER